MLFHRSKPLAEPDAHDYDFAKMVKTAREHDPNRFRKLQQAFHITKKPTPPKEK